MGLPKWGNRARGLAASIRTSELNDYREANADIIRSTVKGIGIDSKRKKPGAGAKIVYNVSSAHVRAALVAGYKNCYDLQTPAVAAVGDPTPTRVSARRRAIDAAIAQLASPTARPDSLYYGALELNGAGMRYYGDMCLVLRDDRADPQCLILYRNSYDLDRAPIRARVKDDPTRRRREAQKLAGRWREAPDMAVCKILESAPGAARLMTSGAISQGLLADEDYIEVVREASFGAGDLAEMRTSASDVAAETRIADRLSRGPTPTLAELVWRHRRRDAERAAAEFDVPVRVISSGGRVRG